MLGDLERDCNQHLTEISHIHEQNVFLDSSNLVIPLSSHLDFLGRLYSALTLAFPLHLTGNWLLLLLPMETVLAKVSTVTGQCHPLLT